jgi:hypothetical protein
LADGPDFRSPAFGKDRLLFAAKKVFNLCQSMESGFSQKREA